MRVYHALCFTLLWSLQAAAWSKLNFAKIVPLSHISPSRLQSIPPLAPPNAQKMSRLGTMLKLRRTARYSSGRGLLELRAGANMVGMMSKFSKTITSSKTKSWILLILCICNETVAVTITKRARDASEPRLMAVAVVMYVCTLFGFSLSLAQIDVSIAYSVWAALGSAIVTTAGILLFQESYNWKKLACLICIIVGVVGLNLLDER